MSFWMGLYLVALGNAAIASTAFPIVYHVVTRGAWKDSAMGRHLMSYRVVLAALIDLTFIASFDLIEGTLLVVVGATLYLLLGVLLWQWVFDTVRLNRPPVLPVDDPTTDEKEDAP